MNMLTSALVLCLAFAVHGLPSPRIVGGAVAPDGKYPYQVALKLNGTYICGGSIIHKRYILTAGHCIFYFSKDDVTVHVGTNSLSNSGTVYHVETAIISPGFRDFYLSNDICLLRVTQDIVFTEKVQPIPIATTDFAGEGHPAVMTGWGQLNFNGRYPDRLRELDVKVSSLELCKSVHWRVTNDSVICTFTKSGEGACEGDSGGPLVADGVQIGVVSFGIPCAVGHPDVFTRVFKYKDWILKHVQS